MTCNKKCKCSRKSVKRGKRNSKCKKAMTPREPGSFYIQGKANEVRPGIFVEHGSKVYPKCSVRGKMQRLAFDFAAVFGMAAGLKAGDAPMFITTDEVDPGIKKSVKLLKKIAYPDSQLYYPSSFGFEFNRDIIELGVRQFPKAATAASVWFPANGWVFNTERKFGVVGSGGEKKCYYHFCVEVQFRQTSPGRGDNPDVPVVTNDCWSIYADEKLEKFYQIKEWLDGQVRRLQPQESAEGNQLLTYDYENINVLPWPPVGKCLTSNEGNLFFNRPNGDATFSTKVEVNNFGQSSGGVLDIEGCNDPHATPSPNPKLC